MDEATLALLGSLVEIRRELGEGVYEAAIERARLAQAAEVMVEAERRALRHRREARREACGEGTVIAFPSRGQSCGSERS